VVIHSRLAVLQSWPWAYRHWRGLGHWGAVKGSPQKRVVGPSTKGSETDLWPSGENESADIIRQHWLQTGKMLAWPRTGHQGQS
jgi:hypothetical protein